MMKFNILSFALHPELGNRITNSYAFAWERGVYPYFDESAPWHEPFADDFDVSPDMMADLAKHLDDAWDLGRGTAPTFYEMECHYETRSGGTEWDRSKLIGAMRYFALCDGRMNDKFWREATRDAGAPSEANGFARPFDRESEIYFM